MLGEALVRRRGAVIALGTENLHRLDPGQREALALAAGGADLALITGRAGTGKTTTLARVRDAYEAAGWRVLGAAPTGKAAEGLQKDAGIPSATIASWLLRWGEGKDLPDAQTVVVVDEAGMVGTGDMRRVLEVVEAHGARVRLVGDANQLAPVAGGQPFRALGERHGAALMETVWRQREKWQQDATSKLANFQVGEALRDYGAHQRVESYRTRDQAIRGLVAEYLRDVEAHPDATRLALTATKADRGRINDALRTALVERGLVGAEGVRSAAGELALGDRVVFRRNDHVARHVKLLDAHGRVVEAAPGSRDGVKNGSLGTVIRARPDQVDVALDDGRVARFNPQTWQKIEYAYALHVDLAQGATVDRAYVLAGERFQRNGAYVALSRHRDDVKLFFDRETFPDRETLAERFGRGRYKQNLADLAPAAREALSGRARVVYGLQPAPKDEPATMVAEGGRAMQEEPRTEKQMETGARAPLHEAAAPERLDLVAAELRLHQVDAQRAWANVQGLVERSLTEPDKTLEAMRGAAQKRGPVSVDDVLEAGLNAGARPHRDMDAVIRELRPRVAAARDHEKAIEEAQGRIEALKSERIGAPEREVAQVEALKSERVGSPEIATPASELQAGRIDPGDAVRVYREKVAPQLAREGAETELTPELGGRVEQQAQGVLELRDQERAVAGLEQQVQGLREPQQELARVEARVDEGWKRIETIAGRAFAEPDRAVQAMREAVEKGRPIPEVLKAGQGASDLRGGGVSRAGRREARQALDELSKALSGVTQQHMTAERLRGAVRAGAPGLATAEAALGRAQQALVGLRSGNPEASLSDTLRALSGTARTAALAALPPKLQVVVRPVVRAIEATRNLAPDLELGR
ncbi:MAG: AAA family ATPase [Candidatus Limnocylindria bacterium]